MHRWTRHVALIALASFLIVEAADAEGIEWRIRSLDASVQALLADGYRRSPTLQRLAADIARTDGIVYVQADACPVRNLRACLLHAIQDTGDFRYLFIRITSGEDPDEMLASMAHELQHAHEVLSQKWIRSRWDMLTFYRSTEAGAFGRTPPGSVITSYETQAAVDITGKVRSELAAAADGGSEP